MDRETKPWVFLGLSLWFVINIIQASFTLLSHDEAYYWMYSRFLDWGYFDHPPTIAVAIKLGYSLFKSELGVRIICIVLSTLTIYLLAKITNPKKSDLIIFFTIVFSIPLVHAGGFLATPDVPFIFFTTCFFYVYKSYSENDNWKNAALLSLIMALLVYSKYHGVLVIIFSIISNIKILQRKSFWASGISSLILFLPHLIWQYNHDFPSFKYHLFERSAASYKIDYTLEYLGGQLLVLGPFLAIILFVASLKNKNTSLFNKALKFNLLGFMIFFFLSSFKSRVEANWTSAAFIPLIFLSFYYIKNRPSLKKWVFILAVPSLLLIFSVRMVLVLEEMPFNLKVKSEFHLWDRWAEDIEEKAAGLPVVFMNSYQKPSKYTFYTGKPSHTLNNFMYRKNQYDLWPFEDSLQGKKVFLIFNYPAGGQTFRTALGDSAHFRVIDNFRSYNNLKISVVNKPKKTVLPGDSVQLTVELENKGTYDADFSANHNMPSQLSINFYHQGKYFSSQYYPLKMGLIKKDSSMRQDLKFIVPEVSGAISFRIAISTEGLPMGLNSDLNKLKISK